GGGRADAAVSDLDTTVPPAPVVLAPEHAAALVGVDYPREQVLDVLEQIGCTVAEAAGDQVSVTPPSWRPDLTGPAHLVEEVARLAGYDQIPSVLPTAPAGRGLGVAQRQRRDVARALAEHGLTQVLSYPFVGDVHDRMGLPAEDERRRTLLLANPIADDAPALRTSLLDTLLETARRNVGRGATELGVFEIGLVTRPAGLVAGTVPGVDRRPTEAELAALDQAVPAQPRHVAAVLAGPRGVDGVLGPARTADWADAVEAALLVGRTVGVTLAPRQAELAPWHPGRCAAL
ncbi:phenylalanine--tRNA ligase subunit beta, partial [Georgenia sp. 10Sc9-8]|nr:phenylalanine--tRNA ligase subunit beta [Georgenia halotolerans]